MKRAQLLVAAMALMVLPSPAEFVVEKKTIVSIAGLKQDCSAASVSFLHQSAELFKKLGEAQQFVMSALADWVDSSCNGPFAKASRTQLEQYHAQLLKLNEQMSQLERDIELLKKTAQKK